MPISKSAVGAFFFALIGFVDAVYLAIEHFQGVIPPCSLTSGCEQVLTSAYATILGIPVALLGAVYYLIILIALFAYLLNTKKFIFLNTVRALCTLGLVASGYFVSLQVFVIGSYCAYCLVSAVTSLVIFILAWFVFPRSPSPDTLAR